MMTLEELKEARQYSSSVLFCALGSVTDKNARENIANFFTLINTVLDAEIERQSVGKMETTTERRMTMNIKQAINISKGCVMASYMDSEAKQTVIKALNQVAVSKTETAGCEWCERISKYAGFGYATFFEQTAVDEQYEFSVDVMFCPNCGRKIQED